MQMMFALNRDTSRAAFPGHFSQWLPGIVGGAIARVVHAVSRLHVLREPGLLPLPGVSNAVGCGCVSDCCRL